MKENTAGLSIIHDGIESVTLTSENPNVVNLVLHVVTNITTVQIAAFRTHLDSNFPDETSHPMDLAGTSRYLADLGVEMLHRREVGVITPPADCVSHE